jgi:uncharacterized membrane protein YagU involved in acid resistance
MAAMQHRQVEEPLAGRLLRGALGGVLAGLVFAGVTMWFAHSTGGTPDMPLRMISTIVKGDGAMAAGTTSPALGGVVHVVLSALFGMVFALAVPVFRTNGTVALAGTVYGLLLYVVNFLLLTPLVFTIFRNANQPPERQPAVRGLRPRGVRHAAGVCVLWVRCPPGRASAGIATPLGRRPS